MTVTFWVRVQAARALIWTGLRVMPPCRYRTELNAALWVLAIRVYSEVAADRAAKVAGLGIKPGA